MRFRTLVFGAAMWAVLSGCEDDQPAGPAMSSAVDPPQEASPETTTPATFRTVSVLNLSARLPAAWNESPRDQIELLHGASIRTDPEADSTVGGWSRTATQPAPSFTLASLQHSEAYSRDFTSGRVVRDMGAALEEAAAARRLEHHFEPDCRRTHCHVVWGMEGEEVRTDNLTRIWRADGRIINVGCACYDHGCEHMGSCTLPEPPANAEPVGAMTAPSPR